MPLTELILTESVPGLGAEADLVKVRRGYARNYLLPRKMAHEVTPAALRQLNALKQKRAEREARELNDAQEVARRIGKTRFVFTLETGESGKAFGSVTAQDIVNRLKNEVGIRDRSTQNCSGATDQRHWRARGRHQTASRCDGATCFSGEIGSRTKG